MASYTEKEMIGITELGRTLNHVVEKITSNTLEKVAIFKSNKPKAVLVSFHEYERMKNITEIIEHHEIADIVDERMPNGKIENTISHEELLELLRKDGRDV